MEDKKLSKVNQIPLNNTHILGLIRNAQKNKEAIENLECFGILVE